MSQEKVFVRGKQIGSIVLGGGLNPDTYMQEAIQAGHEIEKHSDHIAIFERIEKKSDKK